MLTPGELTLEDLPPIQDLKITLPPQETRLVGTILSVVKQQGEWVGGGGKERGGNDEWVRMERGRCGRLSGQQKGYGD